MLAEGGLDLKTLHAFDAFGVRSYRNGTADSSAPSWQAQQQELDPNVETNSHQMTRRPQQELCPCTRDLRR